MFAKVAPLAFAFLGGCILLVDSSPSGDQFSSTCTLLGDAATSCATCISQTCGTAFQACCADTSCRPMLGQLDQCADGGSCMPTAAGDAGGALATCVTSMCATACNQTPPPPDGPPMGYDCYSDNIAESCSCTYNTVPTTVPCGASSFPNALCCQDKSYPTGNSSSCGCAAVTCSDFGSGCTCAPNNGGMSGTTCDTNTYTTCCASGTTCLCGNDISCTSSQTQVFDCASLSNFSCSSTQLATSNCR